MDTIYTHDYSVYCDDQLITVATTRRELESAIEMVNVIGGHLRFVAVKKEQRT